jgi:hypothetical protein
VERERDVISTERGAEAEKSAFVCAEGAYDRALCDVWVFAQRANRFKKRIKYPDGSLQTISIPRYSRNLLYP